MVPAAAGARREQQRARSAPSSALQQDAARLAELGDALRRRVVVRAVVGVGVAQRVAERRCTTVRTAVPSASPSTAWAHVTGSVAPDAIHAPVAAAPVR